jgi:hypothetical protein
MHFEGVVVSEVCVAVLLNKVRHHLEQGIELRD